MQQRAVGEALFLEATLENRTKAPMLLDAVRFAATEPYAAERVDPPAACEPPPGPGPPGTYIADLALLPPEGPPASRAKQASAFSSTRARGRRLLWGG